jgi:hypothetical protein
VETDERASSLRKWALWCPRIDGVCFPLRACSVCPGMKGMEMIRAGLNPYITCKGFNPVYSCPIPPLLWNKRTKPSAASFRWGLSQ